MSTPPPGRRPGFPLRLDQIDRTGRHALRPESGSAVSTRTSPQQPSQRKPVAAAVRGLLRPQELLQHAARVATLGAAPAGIGLDSVDVRRWMVERLRAGGLQDCRVADTMARVPRHRFVDTALVPQAYEDTSLPIGHGQTISKPSVVARMVSLLMDGASARTLGGLGRVLEIGTGCGYQAAVLADLGRQVLSVERLAPLHHRARDNLDPFRVWRDRIRLVLGDGMLGHPPNAPYDSIIAAAGGESIPQAWLDQLAPGGRLVAPVQDRHGRQSLVVIDATEHGLQRRVHEGVHFVPLKSGFVRC